MTSTLHPGAHYLPGFFDPAEQESLMVMIRDLDYYNPPAPPRFHKGKLQKKSKACLGRKINVPYARTPDVIHGKYERDPSVPPVPAEWKDIASRIAGKVGMTIDADVLIVNRFPESTSIACHVDDDERPSSIAKGTPVVSITLGDDAVWLFGGRGKKDPYQEIRYRSGDVFVFGGPSRLCYHGIRRIYPGTAPEGFKFGFRDDFTGRINITLRQF